MKKVFLIIFLISFCGGITAQKKEKIKGSKFVVVKQHDLGNFDTIDIGEDFEIFLVEGDSPRIEIETDDNLHNVIDFQVNDETLYITTSHKIVGHKKLSIRITFTEQLKTIIAKEKAIVNSLTDLDLEDLTVTAKDNAKVYMTLKSKTFKMVSLKKSKAELNVTANDVVVEMSDSSNMKALINTNKLTFDLYQKANAKIEGDVDDLTIRADNATNFDGKRLTAINGKLIAEGSSDCMIEVKKDLTIEASGNSEIQIYNNPKINLVKFEDSAILYKK